MPDELPVHVNREELHGLEVPATFEAEGPFELALINHGESLHLHVHLDDELSRVAAIDAGNHYVEKGSARRIVVDVDEDALSEDPIYGKIKVVSAYGAETRWIDVELVEPDETADAVQVDESLGSPQPREVESGTSAVDVPELGVLALGFLALVVAILAAVFLQNVLVLLGALVVLAGVLVAFYYLSQE